MMADLTVHPAHSLQGTLTVPGDKSISHRALLTGAIAAGVTRIRNLLDANDVRTTLKALQDLGVEIEMARHDALEVTVEGRGIGGLLAPAGPLQMGNSGTTARLLLGILAGHPFQATLIGDASLSQRPMRRVAEPLERMGAVIKGEIASAPSGPRNDGGGKGPRNDVYLPLTIRGGRLKGIRFESPVASAQVKSAILYAGLAAEGPTTVVEPVPTRDHTERILRCFGAKLEIASGASPPRNDVIASAPPGPLGAGSGAKQSRIITVQAGPLAARELTIPGDFSSAAFFLAAAAIVPGSSLTIRGVGLNPTRTALLGVLKRMGARVVIASPARFASQSEAGGAKQSRFKGEIASSAPAGPPRNDEEGWEPVGDVTVRHAPLKAVTVTPEEVPGLMDELPALMVAATQAEGTTVIEGAGELRVKETDRILSMVDGLTNLGARIRAEGDTVILSGPTPLKGGVVESRGDHRTAMALAVAGLAARSATTVLESEWIRISFPGFAEALSSIRR